MDQQELAEKLKNDPAALRAVMASRDGQALFQALQGNDGGQHLRQAAMEAAGGNTAEMVRLVQQVMASPEGAALVERIKSSIQRQG